MPSSSDFFSTKRLQDLRKRATKALDDLGGGGKTAQARVEKYVRQTIKDLRAAADHLEKRLDIGGAGSRSRSAKKAAATRKKSTAKKRTTGAKKTTARKKSTGRKTTARKSS